MTPRRGVLSGWLLLEALLVLSIASLVAVPLGTTIAAAMSAGAEAGDRLNDQATRAVAAAAVLRLADEGYAPGEIKNRLEPQFPSLTFRVEDSVCHVEVPER